MAGLLTCGSTLSRTFPDQRSSGFIGVALRLQLRGQSRHWAKPAPRSLFSRVATPGHHHIQSYTSMRPSPSQSKCALIDSSVPSKNPSGSAVAPQHRRPPRPQRATDLHRGPTRVDNLAGAKLAFMRLRNIFTKQSIFIKKSAPQQSDTFAARQESPVTGPCRSPNAPVPTFFLDRLARHE